MYKLLCFLIASVTSVTLCLANDWSSCSYDLDDLSSAAEDASAAARRADWSKQEFEEKKRALQNCINFPDVYDLMDDGCQMARWNYDSAKSSYQTDLFSLQSELSTVETHIRSIEWPCGVSFTQRRPPVAVKQQTPPVAVKSKTKKAIDCSIYRMFIGQLSTTAILELCNSDFPEDECIKCLGLE